jgi:hypothetical protein
MPTKTMTCYYCQKEGHVVYECPTVPPCAKCGKKGHKATQCSATKTAPKLVTKPAPKPVTNSFVGFTYEFDDTDDETDDETDNETKFSWAKEMENDFAFMKAICRSSL